MNRECVVVIPAYQPSKGLIRLCAELYKEEIKNVIIVDDGSGLEYREIFDEVMNQYDYRILRHDVNLGKGRTLKDAFNVVISDDSNCVGCVTADADGQHTVKDIKKCMNVLIENPDKLVLGCRDFHGKDIPWKSKYGNNITKFVLGFLCGIKVSDTQTGLRGYPMKYLRDCCKMKGERFDYETNVLLEWGSDRSIIEVPIETIYDSRENHVTHFDTMKDAIRIYQRILAYGFSSLLSMFLDFALFLICVKGGLSVWLATLISRGVSSVANFTMNKKAVFKSDGNVFLQLLKYILLVFVSGFTSAFTINYIISLTNINIVLVKAIVDIVLFFFNYYIQRKFVFKKDKKKVL